MACGMCGSGKGMKICPFSFGIALGLTSAITVFLWSVWVMYNGVPPEMATAHPEMTFDWMGSLTHALWALLKGFVFGFVLILIYDGVLCCWKRCRCGANCTNPSCNCSCHSGNKSMK